MRGRSERRQLLSRHRDDGHRKRRSNTGRNEIHLEKSEGTTISSCSRPALVLLSSCLVVPRTTGSRRRTSADQSRWRVIMTLPESLLLVSVYQRQHSQRLHARGAAFNIPGFRLPFRTQMWGDSYSAPRLPSPTVHCPPFPALTQPPPIPSHWPLVTTTGHPPVSTGVDP